MLVHVALKCLFEFAAWKQVDMRGIAKSARPPEMHLPGAWVPIHRGAPHLKLVVEAIDDGNGLLHKLLPTSNRPGIRRWRAKARIDQAPKRCLGQIRTMACPQDRLLAHPAFKNILTTERRNINAWQVKVEPL